MPGDDKLRIQPHQESIKHVTKMMEKFKERRAKAKAGEAAEASMSATESPDHHTIPEKHEEEEEKKQEEFTIVKSEIVESQEVKPEEKPEPEVQPEESTEAVVDPTEPSVAVSDEAVLKAQIDEEKAAEEGFVTDRAFLSGCEEARKV